MYKKLDSSKYDDVSIDSVWVIVMVWNPYLIQFFMVIGFVCHKIMNHFPLNISRVIIFYLMIFPACHIYDKYMSKRIKRGKLRTRQKTQRRLFQIHIWIHFWGRRNKKNLNLEQAKKNWIAFESLLNRLKQNTLLRQSCRALKS